MTFINGILLGFYICGVIATFIFAGFFTVLGGKDSDLWEPFVYSVVWPLLVSFYILRSMYRFVVGA